MVTGMKERTSIPICCWAAEDIPSVKANKIGYGSLSNAELLSIVIGSGSMTENAVEVCRRLLYENDNNLKTLKQKRIDEIMCIKGIGKIKASKILASLELGNRMMAEHIEDKPRIDSATKVYNYMYPKMCDLDVEEFWCLFMNQDSRLLKAKRISIGGISETIVDIRIIMREAVICNATIIIAVHNHPSASIRPSKPDEDLTRSIGRACEIMHLYFADHVIITDGMYYSFHEQGKM